MSTPSERFRRRKERRDAETNSPKIHVLPPEALVQEFLSSAVDYESIRIEEELMDRKYHFRFNVNVSDDEVNATLRELRGKFDSARAHEMANACKNGVIASIAKPFGLGKVVARGDKVGGNVSTVSNAKKGIFANETDRERWEEWEKTQTQKFDRKPYEKGIKQLRKQAFNKSNEIEDGYTGKILPVGANGRHDGRTQVDHVVSAKEIHDRSDLALYFSEEERIDIATSTSNFCFTESRLNQSKGEKRLSEWMALKSPDGVSNAERFEMKKGLTVARDIYARAGINSKVVKEVSNRLAETGAVEGTKLGLQQAIGILLMEFVNALWSELKDVHARGFKEGVGSSSFLQSLKKRFLRVSKAVMARWKDVVTAFGAGAISGFFSNLVTFLIQGLGKTLARVNRIIREGFFSLLHAIKVVCFPPPEMTLRQAAHEATKLIAAGLTIAGGILIEEFVEKALLSIPVLGLFASLIAPVAVGILTGITASILVYFIDKADLFGVIAEQRYEFVRDSLERDIAVLWNESQDLLQEFSPETG